MKKIVIFLTLCLPFLSNAQIHSATVKGTIQFPTQTFKDFYSSPIYMYGGQVAFKPQFLPFRYGVELNQGRINQLHSTMPVIVNGVETKANLEVTSKKTDYLGFVQLHPFRGPIQPYVGAHIGLAGFNTKSNIINEIIYKGKNDEDVVTYSSTPKETINTGMGWQAGWRAGVGYALIPKFTISAEIGKNYTQTMRYLDPSSVIVDDNGIVSYSLLEGPTSTFNASLGIQYKF